MDALVAEKVLGCKLFRNNFVGVGCGCLRTVSSFPLHGWTESHAGLAYYSADLAASFDVLKMLPMHWRCLRQIADDEWVIEESGPDYADLVIARADTAPLAICLAALKLRGVTL